MGNLGANAAKYVPDILNFLKDEKVDANVRGTVATTLTKIKQLKLEEIVVILNYVDQPNPGDFSSENSDFEYWRFLTYFLGGGTDEVKTLLKWLGHPTKLPDKVTRQQGVNILTLFSTVWEHSQGLEQLKDDLAQKIADVAIKVPDWKPQDITLLQTHHEHLKKDDHNQADTVKSTHR